jgi:hypothetical protein
MKMRLAMAAAAVAIWLASPALNTAYVPWGAGGASTAFASAATITLISMFAMVVALRRSAMEDLKSGSRTLVATVAVLIIAEILFWTMIDVDNNKPMLSRQSAGIDAGLVAAGLAALGALWPGRTGFSPPPLADGARWIARALGGALVLELALFAVRTMFHRTPGYYAMDCSMFAVAAISTAMVVAVLCRSIPLRRRQEG